MVAYGYSFVIFTPVAHTVILIVHAYNTKKG